MKKLTPSELWAVHSLEVIVFSACFSFILQCYQAFQAGTFSLQTAGVAAGSLALALIGNGLKGMISNANTAQAIEDFINQMTQRQQPVSPVTIHNTIPAASTPPAAPVVAQPPTTPTPLPAPQMALPTLQREWTNLETPTVSIPQVQ